MTVRQAMTPFITTPMHLVNRQMGLHKASVTDIDGVYYSIMGGKVIIHAIYESGVIPDLNDVESALRRTDEAVSSGYRFYQHQLYLDIAKRYDCPFYMIAHPEDVSNPDTCPIWIKRMDIKGKTWTKITVTQYIENMRAFINRITR